MELAIFAKKRLTKDGKVFYNYLSTMTKKDGSTITATVKFRDECNTLKPENCPVNIIVNKENANLSTRDYKKEDTGEIVTSYTLWVSAWEMGSPFIDHSLDDFE